MTQQRDREIEILRETALRFSMCRRQLDKLAAAIRCYQRQYPHEVAFDVSEGEAKSIEAEEQGLSAVAGDIRDWIEHMEQHCQRRLQFAVAVARIMLERHPDTVCSLKSVLPQSD